MWMWKTMRHIPHDPTINPICFFHLSLTIQANMSPFLLRILLPVLLLVVISPQKSNGEFEQWCVADVQATDAELQAAINYTCGEGGADCSKIQENQPCYLPNTLKDHASFAFNAYYQKFKHNGASCYFNSAAITTEKDPSYSSCHYDYTP